MKGLNNGRGAHRLRKWRHETILRSIGEMIYFHLTAGLVNLTVITSTCRTHHTVRKEIVGPTLFMGVRIDKFVPTSKIVIPGPNLIVYSSNMKNGLVMRSQGRFCQEVLPDRYIRDRLCSTKIPHLPVSE
jgi:hypothetical protein